AIIESDDGVTIVDTHSKPSAARVIVERLRGITTKPVRYVVNTHFHWDHWHGNEVYPAAYPHAEIVTNQLTREAMVRKGLKRIQDHVRQGPQEIAQLKADLATARAPAERARLEAAVRLAESYLAEVRALRPALRPRHGRRRARRGRRGRHARGSPAARARTARPRVREALFPLRSLSPLAPGSPRQHRAHLHDGELGRASTSARRFCTSGAADSGTRPSATRASVRRTPSCASKRAASGSPCSIT